MPITTCIFDAYGTLFDVAAAARQAASEPQFSKIKDTWPQLAEHWRLKQLQYTWLRAITQAHTDFWEVTQDGLGSRDAANLKGSRHEHGHIVQRLPRYVGWCSPIGWDRNLIG